MKKLLFITALISLALIFINCSKKDDTTTNNNNTDTTKTTTTTIAGTYNATGSLTFKAAGVDYSIPVTIVGIQSYSLTINAINADINNYANLIVSIISTNSVGVGTYTVAGYSSITFADHSGNIYQASSSQAGSSFTINLTTLSSTSVQGTFTATAIQYLSGTGTVSITNGVINCTLTSKRSK